MSKETIIVSRQWNNPTIRAFMDSKEVGAEMDTDVFLRTLVEIMGAPTFLMTKNQLATKLLAAKDQLITEMKKATVHV